MRYSIEPRDRIYVKGYGFLSFARNMCKNVSNKYGQKLFDSAKKSTRDAIKAASKRAIRKRAEATGDVIGNKVENSKISDSDAEVESPKKDTYLQKKGDKLLMN